MAEAIVTFVGCLLTAIVVALIEGASSEPPEEAGGRATLSHGVTWRAFAGFTTVICGIGAAFLVVETITDGLALKDLAALLVVALFLAIGVWMMREGRRTFVLDTVGIHSGARARTPRTIAWQDIRGVECSHLSERITLRDAVGGVLTISKYMRGLDRLWSLLEAHVAPDIWSAASEKVRGRRGRPFRKAR